ncbi:MAG: LolA family protein [Candidatus Marisimplicoccus sp.]
MVKNKILIKFIVILLGFSNLSAQEAAIDILERVRENAFSLENVYYKFEISSKFENNILPISGEFFINHENYLIDTNEIDQIYDGEKFYTIIHENKEIIISTENTSFFNFSPNQIFNYFLKGFDLTNQNITGDFYHITAESKEEEIFYNLFINSNLSIERIDMIEKETGEEINRFLTLTYDYNLNLPLSLFKFDLKDYKDYLIVTEN